jgi:hypothetical protein
MTTQLNYKTRTPKKMLGATLKLKAQPSQGVALEKARCTETVCAAGKTCLHNCLIFSYVYRCQSRVIAIWIKSGFVLASATHVIWQAIIWVWVNIRAELMRCNLPISQFANFNNPITRNSFCSPGPSVDDGLRNIKFLCKIWLRFISDVFVKFHLMHILKPIVSLCQTLKVLFL